MAAAIPDPLPAWKKWLLHIGVEPGAPIIRLVDYVGGISDASDPSAGTWMHLQITFEDLQSHVVADRMVTTFDIVNITGGGLDSSWTDDDFTTVDGHVETLLTSWAAIATSDCQATKLSYYPRVFNPYTLPKPFPPLGPPAWVTTVATTGTLAGFIPHQVAMTTTDKTALPRHWGRNYWPCISTAGGAFVSGGLASHAVVDYLANMMKTFYEGLASDDFFPTVPASSAGGTAFRQLLGVSEVQVDDVADVQRRRRKHSATYRKSYTAP